MPSGGFTFVVGNGGSVKRSFSVIVVAPFTPVTLKFDIERDWFDFYVGTTDGDEDIMPRRRLYPGVHLMTFTPSAICYVTFSADEFGTRYVSEPTLVTDPNMKLATPYSLAEARDIKLAQTDNAMFMFHRSHAIRVLERWDQNSWSLRKFLPKKGPFGSINVSSVTLAPDTRTVSGKLFARVGMGDAANFFRAGHVDTLVKLVHPGQNIIFSASAIETWSPPIRVFGIDAERVFTVNVTGTYVGTLAIQRSIGNDDDFRAYTGGSIVNGLNTIDDGLDNQVVYYRVGLSAYTSGEVDFDLSYFYGSTTGTARITSITSVSEANIQIYDPFGKTEYTSDWYFGQWNELFGWPEAGAFHDDRLFVGRDTNRWLSQPSDYENFELDDTDAGAINRISTVGKSSRMTWAKSVGPLMLGSRVNESTLGTGSLEEVITPTNVRARLQSDKGSNGSDAMSVDQRVLWANASGLRMYEIDFSDTGIPRDLTRLHSSIAGGGFIEYDFQQEPEPRGWMIREDGEVAVLLYERAEQVEGWQRYRREGDVFQSLSVHPLPTEDRIMFVVDRNIDGTMRRFLEVTESEARLPTLTAHRLHCAIEQAVPGQVVGGLGHLEGQRVYGWADGQVVGTDDDNPLIPDGDGEVDLGFAPTQKVYIGLEAPAEYLSGVLAYAATAGGTALTQLQKVTSVGISILDTPPAILQMGEALNDEMFSFEDRLASEGMSDTLRFDSALQTLSGIDVITFDSSWSLDARFALRARWAGPATVLFMVPNMVGAARG